MKRTNVANETANRFEVSSQVERTERTELRTANRKIYENADHTMTAEIFLEPVHYQDADDSWKEMDDTLVEVEEDSSLEDMTSTEEMDAAGVLEAAQSAETSAAELVSGNSNNRNKDFENTKGDWKVKFHNKIKKNGTISLKKGNQQLSWSPEGAAKVKGEKSGPSEVIYPNLYDGVDLHCRVHGEKVKEDLVVQEKENALVSISYLYEMKNLTPQINSQKDIENNEGSSIGKTVRFLDEDGKEVFVVSAPYMVDAAGEISTDIHLELELLEEDSCRITFTPDQAWLQAEERVYPVIIDPVTNTSLGVTEIYDAQVSLGDPNGSDPYNYMANMLLLQGGNNVCRSFFKFELPEIKSSDMILYARMLAVSADEDHVQRSITAHRVLQNWESSSITWNNKPVYHEEAEDICTYTADTPKYVTFDLTRLVKDWYQSGKNYGVMLKRENELSGTTTLLSSDFPYTEDTTLRPKIQIQYRSFSGLEGFWSYHSQSVGRAGTVSVNDYCGNLIMKHDAVATGGSRMPAQLSLVYNSTYRTFQWGYGRGFRLNYYQTIASEKIGETQYYRYTDGDGTVHYFYYNDDDDKKKWMDESGLDLTLVRKTESDGSILIDITDKEGNTLHFNGGYLEKIIDRNGNTLLIERDASQKSHITKVTDGAGRVITLTYVQNSDGTLGNLSEITDPAGRKKTFTYDSNDRLISITDHDGTVTTYGYSGSWLLNKVQDQEHYRVGYSYYNTIPFRVKKIQEYGRTSAAEPWEAGNSLTLEYGYNSTKFTDGEGRKEIYRFNHCGNLICIQDDAGHAVSARYFTEGNHINRLQNTTKLQSSVVQLLKDPIIQAETVGWTVQKSDADAANLTAEVNTDTDYCMVGTKSLKLQNTLSTGYVGWRQNVTVERGKTYMFSMYVRATIDELGDNGGARLRIRYQDNSGTWKMAQSEVVTATTYGFVRLKCKLEMPVDAGGEIIRCVLLLYNAKGTLYGDMAQLEEGSTASRCNLVNNGDFVKTLTGFSKTGSAVDRLVKAGDSIYKPARYLMVVNSDSAAVYASPSKSATVLETLSKGARAAARIYYIVENGDGTKTTWYEVDTTSGKRGYILSASLRIYLSGADSMASAVCAGDGVNVRESASVNSAIVVGGLQPGDTMCIRSTTEDENKETWYQVSLQKNGNRYSGFVKGDYVLRLCINDPQGTITESCNLYASPSATASAAKSLVKDDIVAVRGVLTQSNGTKWYAVQHGSGFAYLQTGKATLDDEPNVGKTHTTVVPENIPGLNDQIFCFHGEAGAEKKLTKTLDLTGIEGDVYMVNAWGCGTPLPFSLEDRKFGVEVTFVNTDGSTTVKQASFNPDINEWQFLSEVVVAEKDYTSLKVAYVYCKNANMVFMDGLSLYREEFGQSYAYDEDNNLISAVDNQKQITEFEYNSSQDMTGVTDTKGNNFKYEYDDKHNVTKGTSAQGMIYRMLYDDYGNIVRSGPKKSEDSTVGLWLKRTMDEQLHTHVTEVKDTYGNTTKYTWNADKDLMTSIEDGRGNVLSYGYDSSDRLTSVSQQVKAYGATAASTVTNTYEYDKDRLTKIGHNGFHYQFFHDAFGNTSKVSIAGNEVISYTYESDNGKLETAVYGNGARIRYVYDEQDRVKELHYKASAEAEEVLYQSYVYGKDGNLDQVKDHLSGKKYDLDYDFLDRLMRVRDESDNYYEYTYDSENLMTRLVHGTSNGRNVMYYAYDKDGREISTRMGTRIRTTVYDELGRLKSQTWGLTNNENAPAIATSYTYPVVNETHEGNLPSVMTTPAGTYAYTYDKNGNITRIDFTEAGSTTAVSERYQYDELNQLIREDSQSQGKTFIYNYDMGGNLTGIQAYVYTTGAISGTPLHTSTGIYQTQNTNSANTSGEVWKDQLVSWSDGESNTTYAMTYDPVGNMLSKGSRTFEWKLGRKLAKVTDGTTISEYEYDHTGNRVKKNVTTGTEVPVETTYRMAGDLLLSEKTGSQTIWYEYDSGANLVSMKTGGKRYFYIKNVQKDIVGLADANGNVVVRYQYDAWGNCEEPTGSLADTIGKQNPFRYRGYYYDTETGVYYVSSRYYDPEIGRFISADGKISGVGGDVRGYNLYSYCFNNPVNMTDPDGNWPQFIKKAVKWVTQKVIKPVTKTVKKALSKINRTYSTGINVSGTPSIFCFNAQGGISVDTKGNVAVQGSFSGGVTGGTPSASITVYQSRTNAPNINKLEGLGYQLGGSAGIPVGGVPLAGGADFNIIPDSATGKNYYGTTTSFGVGIPGAELHVEWGNTATWNATQFNIFDSIDQWCINIMEW